MRPALVGKYVRIAARYQEDGTLVATRIWASSSFANVWVSPEGHVLHVNATNHTVTVRTSRACRTAAVDANTQFFFGSLVRERRCDADRHRHAFLSGNLVRGFKVHASVVDPLATPLGGAEHRYRDRRLLGRDLGWPNDRLSPTRTTSTRSDDYMVTLDYISPSSANGEDASGNSIMGFK